MTEVAFRRSEVSGSHNFCTMPCCPLTLPKSLKKEGDSIGKWGGDLAKRHTQSTHKMAFHLGVLDTQEQVNAPQLSHKLRCWWSCTFYCSALEVPQMSTPLRDADTWTQFSEFSRMRRNSAFSSLPVPNQAANGGDICFTALSCFPGSKHFCTIGCFCGIWTAPQNPLHRILELEEVLLASGYRN